MRGFIFFILVLFIFLSIFLSYYLFHGVFNHNKRVIADVRITSSNPAHITGYEDSVRHFNESFIYYLLEGIKAYKLHNPPLSSDTPKIEIIVGDEVYNAEIVDGKIFVYKGEIEGEDIIIITTKEDAVKMLLDRDYVMESFSNGSSRLEVKAGKAELFAKGYLGLYEEITGEKIVKVMGNAILGR